MRPPRSGANNNRGFMGLGSPMIFTIASTLAGPRAAGRWAGAQNLAGQMAGVVAPLVTGVIVGSTGSFSAAFAIAAAAAALSMVAWGVIVPTVTEVRWADPPARGSLAVEEAASRS